MIPNPTEPRRRSIRMPTYDYSREGGYFVTICTHNRRAVLGRIIGGEMRPSPLGEIVRGCWLGIPDHLPDIQLDESVVMPNHVHGIILVGLSRRLGWSEPDGDADRTGVACYAPTAPADSLAPRRLEGPAARALGAVVRSFKSAVAKRVNELRATPGQPVWHRNYYEHVIRNADDLAEIRQYIADNPLKWDSDRENPGVQV